MKTLGFLAIALAACGGDDPTPDAAKTIDAPHTTIDAPHTTVDAPSSTIDAPAGNACTGAVYDPCTVGGGGVACGSGLTCKSFNGAGFSVCTPACSASAPCPNQGSTAITCNNMGSCKPPAPNSCTP